MEIFVWNLLALLLTLVIVSVTRLATPDVNAMKDLFEINMEIVSNPTNAQIRIVHITKFTPVRLKFLWVGSKGVALT